MGLLVEFKGFVVGPSIFARDMGILINTIGDNNKIFEADRRAMTKCTVSGLSANCCNYAAHLIYTYCSFTLMLLLLLLQLYLFRVLCLV